MPEHTVSVSVVANMSNYLAGMQRGSAATAGLGKQAQTSGELTRAFVGKIGNSITSLGNQVGGTVGAVLDTLGSGLDKVSAKSAHLSTAFEVGGGAAVAAAIGLEQLGSSAVQATDQLNAAITSTGDSVSDYSKRVDDAVASGENLGRSSEDTKAALTALIPAAGSTSKALSLMDVVTNLAAAKHESLATAATAVARVLGGNGSRTLSVYGIQMDGVGSKTEQGTRALAELEVKLNGQASAAVNNFGGEVGIVTTKIGDFVKEAAGPAGQILTGIGIAATGAGFALDVYKAHQVKVTAATAAAAAAAAADTAAVTAESAAIEAQTGFMITNEATIQALVEGNVAFATSADGVTVAIGGEGAAAAASGAAVAGGLAAISAAILPVTAGVLGLYAELVGIKAASGGIQDLLGQTKTLAQYTDAANVSAKKLAATLGGSAMYGGSSFKSFVSETGNFQFDAARNLSNTPVLGAITPTPAVVGEADKADTALALLSGKQLATVYQGLATQANAAGAGAGYMADVFPKATAALAAQTGGASTATTKTGALAATFNAAALNAANLASTTDELEKTLGSYGQAAQSAESATEGWYSALDAATAAVKANGKNIDDQTAKGRANNSALYGLASAADAVATANLKAKVPIDQVNASLDKAKSQFVTVAEQMGYTKTAAEQLAAKLIGVATTKYRFTLDGVTVATNNLNTYLKALSKIPGKVSTQLSFTGTKGAAVRTGGFIDKNGVSHFASGGGYGQFRGPGSGTSDSILAMVSNGEYINTAATVARLGVGYFQALNRGANPFRGGPAPYKLPSFSTQPAAYQKSPLMHTVDARQLNISLDMSGIATTSPSEFGQLAVQAIRTAMKNGAVSTDWVNRA